MDLFPEGTVPSALDLAERRETLLGADLDRALLRVATLESEAEALRREIAALQEELDLSARRIGGALATRDALGRYPAAGQAALLERLTIVQRRDAWLGILARSGHDGPAFGIAPHNGGDDPLTVLLVGSGGIGDAVYLSTVARALHDAFPTPRIIVLHDHPAATTIFAQNPFVLDTIILRDAPREALLDHAHALDVFDLVADVRYVVSYATPPLSRIPPAFLHIAHGRAAPWQRYVRFDWPHRNNSLAREAARLGMGKLDLLGFTANLAIDRTLPPDLFAAQAVPPDGDDPLAPLAGRAYVTIHHGAAANMAGDDGLQTKNLSLDRWAEIAAGLAASGHAVVQLGAPTERLVPGVELDLRGRTDLPATVRVLQHASLHLDTEGGLVHLARTRRTPAVVMFGPTPPGFFGYPGNANLAPQRCGDCWWTARDWAARCPLGEEQPPCMASHDVASVLAAAAVQVRTPVRVELAPPTPIPSRAEGPALALASAAVAQLAGTQGALLFVDDRDLLATCLADPGIAAAMPRVFVPAPILPAAREVAAGRLVPQPAPRGFIPAETGSLPGAVAIISGTWEAADWLGLAAEMARVTTTGTPTVILAQRPGPTLADLRTAAHAWPGGAVRFTLPRRVDAGGPWQMMVQNAPAPARGGTGIAA